MAVHELVSTSVHPGCSRMLAEAVAPEAANRLGARTSGNASALPGRA